MKSIININQLPDEVVANLSEKLENLPLKIQDYLTLKDLVVDENNYYYPIYNIQGDFDSFEILASKKQILGEEFDCQL